MRIVRSPEGTIEIDPKGKRLGRGAYLCPCRGCWQVALEQKRLERVLKCQVSAEEVVALRAAAESLLEEAVVSES